MQIEDNNSAKLCWMRLDLRLDKEPRNGLLLDQICLYYIFSFGAVLKMKCTKVSLEILKNKTGNRNFMYKMLRNFFRYVYVCWESVSA